jgi:hypothetical protein
MVLINKNQNKKRKTKRMRSGAASQGQMPDPSRNGPDVRACKVRPMHAGL